MPVNWNSVYCLFVNLVCFVYSFTVTIIDVRSVDHFNERRFQNSINCPLKVSQTEFKVEVLEAFKGTNIVIVGEDSMTVEPVVRFQGIFSCVLRSSTCLLASRFFHHL
jgi:hypothetical protein